MAARLNPKQDERARSAIQTTQLCKRLNNFALELPDPATGRVFVMTEGQIRAAVALLRKTMPDLAVTSHTGADGIGPVEMIVTGVRRAMEIDEPQKPLGFVDDDAADVATGVQRGEDED